MATPGQNGNGDKSTTEQDIQDDGKESKENFSSEAAGEDDSEDGVNDTDS